MTLFWILPTLIFAFILYFRASLPTLWSPVFLWSLQFTDSYGWHIFIFLLHKSHIIFQHADGAIRPGRDVGKIPQDRGDGVQDMLDSRGTGRWGLHMLDDGGGVDFQGEIAVMGDMHGVREGTG